MNSCMPGHKNKKKKHARSPKKLVSSVKYYTINYSFNSTSNSNSKLIDRTIVILINLLNSPINCYLFLLVE